MAEYYYPKYLKLRCLSLSLYENSREPENVLENYNFNLSYTDKDTNLELDL